MFYITWKNDQTTAWADTIWENIYNSLKRYRLFGAEENFKKSYIQTEYTQNLMSTDKMQCIVYLYNAQVSPSTAVGIQQSPQVSITAMALIAVFPCRRLS